MNPDVNNLTVVDFPVVKPLAVSADKIDRVIVGASPKTFANWRSRKIGPVFHMVGGKPYYKISDLESYFFKNPVKTTEEP
jgi:hypothetical protein